MPRSPAFGVAVAVSAGAYAWWVAGTQSFTARADLAVAVGFGAAALLAAHAIVRRRRPAVHPPDVDARPVPGPAGSFRAWAVVAMLLVVLELGTYLAGSGGARNAFPTLSSLYDQATTVRAAKAAIVFAWLALGWGLFRR